MSNEDKFKAAIYDDLVRFVNYDVNCSSAAFDSSATLKDVEANERVLFAALYAHMLVQAVTAGRDQLMPKPLSERLIKVCQSIEGKKAEWIANHPDVKIPQTVGDVRTWTFNAIISMLTSPAMTQKLERPSGKALLMSLMITATMCDAALVGKMGDADHLMDTHTNSIVAFAKTILPPEVVDRIEAKLNAARKQYSPPADRRPGPGSDASQN